jgi:hypothetical protein
MIVYVELSMAIGLNKINIRWAAEQYINNAIAIE